MAQYNVDTLSQEPPKDTWTTGQKFDQDKPRMDLLDSLALEGLAKVLTFGAKKYVAHNWRGGISYSRLIAAGLRHIFALLRGEDTDPESGLPHVDHLGCCWMFLSNMMKTRKDLDDRYKLNEPAVREPSVEQLRFDMDAKLYATEMSLLRSGDSQCKSSLDRNQGWIKG